MLALDVAVEITLNSDADADVVVLTFAVGEISFEKQNRERNQRSNEWKEQVPKQSGKHRKEILSDRLGPTGNRQP